VCGGGGGGGLGWGGGGVGGVGGGVGGGGGGGKTPASRTEAGSADPRKSQLDKKGPKTVRCKRRESEKKKGG